MKNTLLFCVPNFELKTKFLAQPKGLIEIDNIHSPQGHLQLHIIVCKHTVCMCNIILTVSHV